MDGSVSFSILDFFRNFFILELFSEFLTIEKKIWVLDDCGFLRFWIFQYWKIFWVLDDCGFFGFWILQYWKTFWILDDWTFFQLKPHHNPNRWNILMKSQYPVFLRVEYTKNYFLQKVNHWYFPIDLKIPGFLKYYGQLMHQNGKNPVDLGRSKKEINET